MYNVSQIISYNVNIWRNLDPTVQQKIVAENRRFLCMYGAVASQLCKIVEVQFYS